MKSCVINGSVIADKDCLLKIPHDHPVNLKTNSGFFQRNIIMLFGKSKEKQKNVLTLRSSRTGKIVLGVGSCSYKQVKVNSYELHKLVEHNMKVPFASIEEECELDPDRIEGFDFTCLDIGHNYSMTKTNIRHIKDHLGIDEDTK